MQEHWEKAHKANETAGSTWSYLHQEVNPGDTNQGGAANHKEGKEWRQEV